MKAKQLAAMIVTGVVIIVVGVTGVLTNSINQKLNQDTEVQPGFWESLMSMEEVEAELPMEEFVGVLDIVGEIGPSATESLFATTTNTYNHDLYMDYVDQLMVTENNVGIMLYIDSPGGTVYESDELYLKLMEYKEVTGRPIWAYFGSQACSGGYYIGMAADKIYANRNCWTGSIGVIISLLNTQGLYEKIGIEEINIASGENKAMGSSGEELTQNQYDILQGLVDEAYEQFVGIVAEGRKMDVETVKNLADGRLYSANQALEHKLIDVVGSYEEEKAAFAKEANFAEDILYHRPEVFSNDVFSSLYFMIEDLKPKSEMEVANDIVENKGNGVLMYYAK